MKYMVDEVSGGPGAHCRSWVQSYFGGIAMKRIMKTDQALAWMLSGKVSSIGFRKAHFKEVPGSRPLELGWFNLRDGDHQAKSEGDRLILELWFFNQRVTVPEVAVKDRRDVPSDVGPVTQIKLVVMLDWWDVEYLHIEQERVWMDWEGLMDDPAIEKNAAAIDEWQNAWDAYIQKLNRLDELKEMGRYGYQLRQPQKSLGMAIKRLVQLDPDFCERIGLR